MAVIWRLPTEPKQKLCSVLYLPHINIIVLRIFVIVAQSQTHEPSQVIVHKSINARSAIFALDAPTIDIRQS